nr:hypothetical protein [Austwickia chelonae]
MIVFCYDQEHAEEVRHGLVSEFPDWTRDDPEWVVQITFDEKEKVCLVRDLSNPERVSPLVATTSRLLATGIDVEDLRFVVIFRPAGSQIEFKQIVRRGTRLYPDKGKTSFEIIDFVGASTHFADPDFDGFPGQTTVETVGDGGDDSGEVIIDVIADGSGVIDGDGDDTPCTGGEETGEDADSSTRTRRASRPRIPGTPAGHSRRTMAVPRRPHASGTSSTVVASRSSRRACRRLIGRRALTSSQTYRLARSSSSRLRPTCLRLCGRTGNGARRSWPIWQPRASASRPCEGPTLTVSTSSTSS